MSRFVPNPAGIAAVATLIGAGLLQAAEAIVETGRDIAPVRLGWYRDSLKAELFAEGKARASSYDFKAHFIEFGTSDTPTFAILRRASESASI